MREGAGFERLGQGRASSLARLAPLLTPPAPPVEFSVAPRTPHPPSFLPCRGRGGHSILLRPSRWPKSGSRRTSSAAASRRPTTSSRLPGRRRGPSPARCAMQHPAKSPPPLCASRLFLRAPRLRLSARFPPTAPPQVEVLRLRPDGTRLQAKLREKEQAGQAMAEDLKARAAKVRVAGCWGSLKAAKLFPRAQALRRPANLLAGGRARAGPCPPPPPSPGAHTGAARAGAARAPRRCGRWRRS